MNPAIENIVNRCAEPLKWLIVAGIAYTLATTIWVFFETPVAQTGAAANAAGSNASSAQRPVVNVNAILGKHLFGEAGAIAPKVDDDEPAVETTLPLELQSVFIADDPQFSAAIVAQKGKPGLLYQVSEKLPGNAELVEVVSDRIILRRGGKRETLLFPKSRNEFQVQAVAEEAAGLSPEARTTQRPPNSTPASQRRQGVAQINEDGPDLEEMRERLSEDANSALDEMGIEANEGGGYKIGDLAQSPYLRKTGLQAGDVILSVNGRPVGNIQSDQLEIDNILAQGSARIEVQRGTRRFFITASIPAVPQR